MQAAILDYFNPLLLLLKHQIKAKNPISEVIKTKNY